MVGLGRFADMSDCVSGALSQVSIPARAIFSNLAARRFTRSYTKSNDPGRTQEGRYVLRVRQVLQDRTEARLSFPCDYPSFNDMLLGNHAIMPCKAEILSKKKSG